MTRCVPVDRLRQAPRRWAMAALVALGYGCSADGLEPSAKRVPGTSTPPHRAVPAVRAPLRIERPAPQQIEVVCHGAASEVSGSLFEVRIGNRSFLVDCGSFYPEGAGTRQEREARADQRNAQIDLSVERVAAVLVTHAHLDHIGRLPLLVERGYDGPIHATAATAALMRPMLEMQLGFEIPGPRTFLWSARSEDETREGIESHERQAREDPCALPPRLTVHSRACEWARRISERNRRSRDTTLRTLVDDLGLELRLCPTCREIECGRVLKSGSHYPLQSDFAVADGVTARFVDAGHIPGSASVVLDIETDVGRRRIVFSGDVGHRWSTLIEGPSPCPSADAVFVETTYGSTIRPDVQAEQRRFRQEVGDALTGGRIVWIPAFALDRTQKILHQIAMGRHEGRIPRTTEAFVPSPTAQDVSAVYRVLAGWPGVFRPELGELGFLSEAETDGRKFCERLFGEIEARRRTPRSEAARAPLLLITTSGMMDAAFSRSILADLLPRSDVTVFLVGYTDPLSEAGQLDPDGGTITTADGARIDVRATVRRFGGFSAHADAAELDAWLADVPPDSTIVLVHGEREALTERAAQLGVRGRSNVLVPDRGATIHPLTR